MAIETINPATGKLVKSYNEISEKEILTIIEEANNTFLEYRKTSFDERRKWMLNAAKILHEKKEEYGKIMTLEMGKPLKQGIAEAEKCAWVCEYYAKHAETQLADEIIETDASESYIKFDPLGVVLAVMPWNFPFWQVFRFAAPALMAGNVGLLKHASNVPLCAMTIEQIFSFAGFPAGSFKTLLIGSKQVETVLNHPKVKAATLTGSEIAGRTVAATCGKLLKKTVMELGGSDPFIILKNADINAAVKTAVNARLINNGQSCIAAKRFIVEKDILGEFENKFVDAMSKIKVGDPDDLDTELGPIAREDLLNELHQQVVESVNKGARLLLGGKRIDREGFYYPATILTNVKPGMPAYEQEIFGPVASVISAEDAKDAIRIANDSDFGLGASLWTKDTLWAKEISHEIESGSVFINGMVKSDPRLPFGGIKNSGYGRELSHYGIKEFVNIKTVWVK